MAWIAGGRTVFVTGETVDQRCPSAVWRSDDAGASWRLVRGSCGLSLSALSFTDARHGLAAGGGWSPSSNQGDQVVLATSDGGADWHKLWEHRSSRVAQRAAYGLVALTFVDRRHGWALPGGIKLGANRPYAGDALATSDGGRHWRDTGQTALALAPVGRQGAIAIDGYGADGAGGPLALARDLGGHWTQLAGGATPIAVQPRRRSWPCSRGAGELTVYTSQNGGVTWRPVSPLPRPVGLATARAVSGDRDIILGDLGTVGRNCAPGSVIAVSRDGGHSWETRSMPGNLLATTDSDSTWTQTWPPLPIGPNMPALPARTDDPREVRSRSMGAPSPRPRRRRFDPSTKRASARPDW